MPRPRHALEDKDLVVARHKTKYMASGEQMAAAAARRGRTGASDQGSRYMNLDKF